jgi:peptidoglycan/xylan/chitin deacetylase (PgdA/CDA1 family)
MRISAGRIVDGVARRVPLTISRNVIRRGVLGVNYHVVSDEHLPHIQHVLQYKSVASFEADVRFLTRHCDVISYDDAVDPVSAQPGGWVEQKGHGNSILLTFDDGYAECFSVVWPILRRHGLGCVFFVIADAVDNRFLVYPNKVSLCIDALLRASHDVAADRIDAMSALVGVELPTVDRCVGWLRSLQIADTGIIDEVGGLLGLDWDQFLCTRRPYLTSDEIRQLVADGFTVGAHSRTHPYMKTLQDRAAVEEEIVESCRFVQRVTGQERVPFAFPFSADGLDRADLQDIVSRHDGIGLLFNTRGLERDRAFMVNRVAGDGGLVPYGDAGLAASMGDVYRRHMVRRLRAVARRQRRQERPAGS